MGHAYEPEANYDTSLGRFRNLEFKSSETPQYCVKVTSGDHPACRNTPDQTSLAGGAIELHFKTKDFTNRVATLNAAAFEEKEMEFCLPIDQVNINDDIFTLQATSSNGVCITSVTVNNEKLDEVFWLKDNDFNYCEDDFMSTNILKIQNGDIDSSTCKTYDITRNKVVYKDVTVHKIFDLSILLNLEWNEESQWSNILGFHQKGIKVYENGYPESINSLVPAVLLRPKSNSMHICMPLNDKKSCWDSPEMPTDTWFKLNIRQIYDHDDKEYVYQILINNEVKQTVINHEPELFVSKDTYNRINGIIGSTYGSDYHEARGQYKDFNFKSEFFRPKPPAGFEHGSDAITPGLKGCSAGENLGRIVGGNIAKKGSWPWFVKMSTRPKNPEKWGQVCGGTILSNTRILARLY